MVDAIHTGASIAFLLGFIVCAVENQRLQKELQALRADADRPKPSK